MPMSGVHDIKLVFLSIMVAIVASFTALSLAGRVRASSNRTRRIWLAAAATALGGGIWSMHFVAMLAFSMPGMQMSYDVAPTLASLALAVGFTGAGFATVDWRTASTRSVLAAGLLIGAGVASMHYLGIQGRCDIREEGPQKKRQAAAGQRVFSRHAVGLQSTRYGASDLNF
jgi:NO-binding membrane sensor protein with MHYT domain